MTIFEEADAKLLPGFKRRMLDSDGNEVLALIAGSGPPLLMLHGDPQTHLCWHAIAPVLTEDFTVVLTDIRGRGEGYIAPATKDARLYSKRAMADEQVSVMRALGFSRFSLVGHDRGARVARRLTLDHPEAVERLAVLDIVPALNLYENFSAELAPNGHGRIR